MSDVVVHPAGTTDVPAGEAVILPLVLTDDAPDLSGYAEAGVLLLPYTDGNIATADPTGDAHRLADLLDSLDLDRAPVPPVALRLEAEHTRENIATAMSYVTNWADAITARGYAPWLNTTPDLIWEAAREGAHFAGCWPLAFEPTDGPAPEDVRNVPGLPADTYSGARAYTYGSQGETIADDGVLARASIQLVEPTPPAPGTDPDPAQPTWGDLPVRAVAWPDGEPGWVTGLRGQLTDVQSLLEQLVAQPKPDTAEEGTPGGQHAAEDQSEPATFDPAGTEEAASAAPATATRSSSKAAGK